MILTMATFGDVIGPICVVSLKVANRSRCFRAFLRQKHRQCKRLFRPSYRIDLNQLELKKIAFF
jgi:hypothetical protein